MINSSRLEKAVIIKVFSFLFIVWLTAIIKGHENDDHIKPGGERMFYIDPDGSDSTGYGSIEYPWASLSFACSNVKSGNTIHVNAGEYFEEKECYLDIGVNIVGEGNESHVISNFPGRTAEDGLLKLESGKIGELSYDAMVNGNQSISYIKLNGNFIANTGIAIWRRNDIKISHCTFTNFKMYGIWARTHSDWMANS